MIGVYPITWLITEALSIVLFVVCMNHALHSDHPRQRLFELCCFILAAAIFEHVGVLTGNYSYDQHRLMMFGLIPLSILLIEAVIMYSAMVLFESMNMPQWSIIWFVGFLSTLQDMTIDPVYINDTYIYNGIASGQWNWKIYYDPTFWGIPFFNFSSWFFMTGLYAGLLLLGRHIYEQKKNEALGTLYPFVAAILLIVPLALVALLLVKPVYSNNTTFLFWYELIALIFNMICGAVLIARYWKRMSPVDIKSNGIVVFAIPAILHLYDVIVGLGLGIERSYVPVIVCTLIHMALLFAIYRSANRRQRN